MEVMPQILMSQTATVMSETSKTVISETGISETGTSKTGASQTKEKKPTYKSIMAALLKPPPKDETKPNIHLGGGQFQKLEKI
jgi:hypothetical protein